MGQPLQFRNFRQKYFQDAKFCIARNLSKQSKLLKFIGPKYELPFVTNDRRFNFEPKIEKS